MGDPAYTEFFVNTGFNVKQEPMVVEQSGGVPIPSRKSANDVGLQGFKYDLDTSNYEFLNQDSNSMSSDPSLYTTLWNSKDNSIKMEDDVGDDIFQVDKSDLIQGPTLAELNAQDNTILEDLNFDDIYLPEDFGPTFGASGEVPSLTTRLSPCYENSSPISPPSLASSFPPLGLGRDIGSSMPSSPVALGELSKSISGGAAGSYRPALSPNSHTSSSSSLLTPPQPTLMTSPLGNSQLRKSPTLTSSLGKAPMTSLVITRKSLGPSVSPDPKLSLNDQSLSQSASSPIRVVYISQDAPHSGSGTPHGRVTYRPGASRLSSSAPSHSGFEHIWQRREPRPHLLSTGSLAEADSFSSLSTGGVLSPEGHDFSLDDEFDSEDDSENEGHYEDFSSDQDNDDSDGEGAGQAGSSAKSAKKERYFWQYNVQSKGPKGQRLVLSTKQEDPHCLNEITDPVFSPACSLQGIKHSGKARKGDGNDLTPNPRKLNSIGLELDKLQRHITDMTPVSELPVNVRPKTRKEKNKLASRACRLKKKAQHEANKIKLVGVECEHRRLMNGISQMKEALVAMCRAEPQERLELAGQCDRIVKHATKVKVAGQTTDFVNKILDKVKAGVPNGGLEEYQMNS